MIAVYILIGIILLVVLIAIIRAMSSNDRRDLFADILIFDLLGEIISGIFDNIDL
jgi:hypothetical protein